jgi:pyruvate dehydrogenase E2 component (dihydrolipoamide acetyltransferase)
MESCRGLPVKRIQKLNRFQKAMAQDMKTSVSELALSQVSRELDFTPLQAFRQRRPVSINTLFTAAVARSLVEHPYLNAQLVGDQIYFFEPVNVGMAVTSSAGLVVAVIANANELSIEALDERMKTLVGRVRTGKFKLEDIEGGTFTISNLGMLGIDAGTPIPRSSEAAIVLLGAVRHRPVAVNHEIVLRQTAWATLTFDHRFIDGACAAAFFQDLQNRLNDLESL